MFEAHYLEDDGDQYFSKAININNVPELSGITSRWAYYRVNAVKVEYLPHQQRCFANPVANYSSFTPANIATSNPPMSVMFTSSEQAMTAQQITSSPSCKTFLQGSRWSMYRKIKLPLIVGAQGNTGVDIKLPSRRTLVSTFDLDIKWGSIYFFVHDVDQDFLDNNDRQPLSFTFKYTYYVTFVKAI